MDFLNKLFMIRIKHDFFRTLVCCGIIDSSIDIVSDMYKMSINIERYLCKKDLDDICNVFDLDEEFDVLMFDLYRYLKKESEVK